MNFENLDKNINLEIIKKKTNTNNNNNNIIIKNIKKKENRKIYSFTLKPSLVDKLEELAEKEDISKSRLLEKIIEKYFKKEENIN